ncbi:MAG: hypothetical protein ACRD43_15180, partial [Pyrinomonadaceae bacterium]
MPAAHACFLCLLAQVNWRIMALRRSGAADTFMADGACQLANRHIWFESHPFRQLVPWALAECWAKALFSLLLLYPLAKAGGNSFL